MTAHLPFLWAGLIVLWVGIALGYRERRRLEEAPGTRPAPYEWPKPEREPVNLFKISTATRWCAYTATALFAVSIVLFTRDLAAG